MPCIFLGLFCCLSSLTDSIYSLNKDVFQEIYINIISIKKKSRLNFTMTLTIVKLSHEYLSSL